MPGAGSIPSKCGINVPPVAPSAATSGYGNTVPPDGAVVKLDLDLLDENPFQPRTAIDEAQLGDLAASIAKSGLLQPVVVRPAQPGRYHIVAGHRRVAAFKKLKTEAATDEERRKFRLIPAHVKRDLDDSQMAVGAYVENVQREALSPVEEAAALSRIKDLVGAATAKEVAQSVGQPERRVRRLLRLNDAPAIIKDGITHGVLVDAACAGTNTAASSDKPRREHRKLDFIGALEFLRLHEHWFCEKPKTADERVSLAVRRALAEGWGVRRIQDFVEGIISGRKTPEAIGPEPRATKAVPSRVDTTPTEAGPRLPLMELSPSLFFVRPPRLADATTAELKALSEELRRLSAQVNRRLEGSENQENATNAGPAHP
jgi:ParB/RepB/Spo0J family partition protein